MTGKYNATTRSYGCVFPILSRCYRKRAPWARPGAPRNLKLAAFCLFPRNVCFHARGVCKLSMCLRIELLNQSCHALGRSSGVQLHPAKINQTAKLFQYHGTTIQSLQSCHTTAPLLINNCNNSSTTQTIDVFVRRGAVLYTVLYTVL